uniref:Uncharacterized protein n=1 Tax=Triticum urartu TaxID=4572 RepID=A0A8R7QID4_TRIUA
MQRFGYGLVYPHFNPPENRLETERQGNKKSGGKWGEESQVRSDGSACCFSSSVDAEIWLWMDLSSFQPRRNESNRRQRRSNKHTEGKWGEESQFCWSGRDAL